MSNFLLDGIAKLKEKAAEKGEEFLEEKGEDAIGDFVKKGRELLDAEVDTDTAKAGHKVLEVIDGNKAPFVRLAKVGLATVVGHWQNDDEAAAKRHYIETQATYDERRAFMQAAGDAAYDEAKEREESWEAVKDVLKEAGLLGLKFLAKALAGSLGIPLPI